MAPGCGVSTLGQRQAGTPSSGLDAMEPNLYSILNWEHKHLKAYLPKKVIISEKTTAGKKGTKELKTENLNLLSFLKL